MPLSSGEQLGHYKIQSMIGKGGMGEVYLGTDTRLGRSVAIKVSSREFNDRFEREARAISTLNHPNICTLHDVGPNYLVMEYIEGETLSKIIERGPLPLDKALSYAVQIVDALAAAHAKGVIHRDLKPGNIMITRNGAKVLDFGLAKLPSERPSGDSAANIETVTEPITRAGAILGTLYYMAPEQVEGKEADERSDIFSFGVVFYEMITGQRPFTGDTQAAVLAALLKDQPPPMSQRQPAVPRQLERVVKKCLEKKPDDRWHSARDLKPTLELIDLDAPPVSTSSASVPIPIQIPLDKPKAWLWPGVAGVLFVALAAVAFLYFRERAPAMPTEQTRFQIALPEMVTVGSFAVSPDGRQLAFLAQGSDNVSRLWLRTLDSLEAHPLPDSDGAGIPFWSPDSKFIAFSSGRQLKKMAVAGGPPQIICAITGIFGGGAWNQDNVIIFGSGAGMMKVSATGGTPSVLTAVGTAVADVHPSYLPDGRHFLYMRGHGTGGEAEDGIYIGSLDSKPEHQSTTRLLDTHFGAVYAPSADPARGQLLFLREGTLWAQPFDAARLQTAGEPISVGERVAGDPAFWYGHFSASAKGVLVYMAGAGSKDLQLTWFDRQGKILGTAGEPSAYSFASLSPDATRAAVVQNGDIWLVDLARGSSTRFTYDPASETNPLWSPDGSRIAFASNRGGAFGLYQKPSSGGSEELLLKTDTNVQPQQYSPDGRFLLYSIIDRKTGLDLWILPLAGDKKPFPYLRTDFAEMAPRISPDGRWVAYRSNETGRPEIYVQPFNPSPDAGTAADKGKWLVSTGAAGMPRWRADGKELYYLAPTARIMAVPVTTSPGFQAGAPQEMFQMPPDFMRAVQLPGVLTDMTADSKRFLLAMPRQQNAKDAFTVVMNWTVGLKH